MQEYDITEIRGFLEKVRGETRVKTKEEGIRNQFIQRAVDEIFVEHDWDMNRRTETDMEKDDDGYFTAPSDFSMFNDFYMLDASGNKYTKDQLTITQDGSQTLISGPTEDTTTLVYYIVAPNLLTGSKKVRFPQPMLIAERAYVRLKTAYFPDETSEKEEARSLRMVRELAMRGKPRPSFKLKMWS